MSLLLLLVGAPLQGPAVRTYHDSVGCHGSIRLECRRRCSVGDIAAAFIAVAGARAPGRRYDEGRMHWQALQPDSQADVKRCQWIASCTTDVHFFEALGVSAELDSSFPNPIFFKLCASGVSIPSRRKRTCTAAVALARGVFGALTGSDCQCRWPALSLAHSRAPAERRMQPPPPRPLRAEQLQGIGSTTTHPSASSHRRRCRAHSTRRLPALPVLQAGEAVRSRHCECRAH